MMDDVERLLLEAELPAPQRDLRARVLGSAMPLVRGDTSRLDRIWFSRTFRVGAMLAVLSLIAIDMVSGRLVTPTPRAQQGLASDVARAVEKLAVDMGMSPADAAELAAQAVASPPQPRLPEDPNSPF